MEMETLRAINDGTYLSLILRVVVLITAVFVIAGLAIYVAGISWFYFEEKRRSITGPRRARCTSRGQAWKSPPRVADTQIRTTYLNKPRADARGIARCRQCAFPTGAASTPPA
jgi:hypothetical protein